MTTQQILDKLKKGAKAATEVAGIFGVGIPVGVSIGLEIFDRLLERFEAFDLKKNWTQEEINEVADEAIADIKRRSERRTRDEVPSNVVPTIEENAEENISANEIDEDE